MERCCQNCQHYRPLDKHVGNCAWPKTIISPPWFRWVNENVNAKMAGCPCFEWSHVAKHLGLDQEK